jgi:hypothetical protein
MLKETTRVASEALDELGTFLMRNVRDTAIRASRLTVDGKMHGAAADAAGAILKDNQDCREAVGKLVPMIVDEVLHALLYGIQESQSIRLLLTVDGQAVNAADISDGLQGEPWSNRGWIARFSAYKEPDYAI